MTHSTNFEAFLASDKTWVADGGLETDLIFADGLDLPHFASFHVFDTDEGCHTASHKTQQARHSLTDSQSPTPH